MLRNLGYAALVAATAAVIAIGSAVPSQAKGKKKPAPPPQPVCMMMDYHPVCAVKGGTKQTYANSCFAAKDGAKVVAQGACKPAKAVKKKKMKAKKPAAKKMKK